MWPLRLPLYVDPGEREKTEHTPGEFPKHRGSVGLPDVTLHPSELQCRGMLQAATVLCAFVVLSYGAAHRWLGKAAVN